MAMIVHLVMMTLEVLEAALAGQDQAQAAGSRAKETGFAQVVLTKISHGAMNAIAARNRKLTMVVARAVEGRLVGAVGAEVSIGIVLLVAVAAVLVEVALCVDQVVATVHPAEIDKDHIKTYCFDY